MKTPKDDIIQELKSLNASFLLHHKERKLEDSNSIELSEEFYKNVMNQIPLPDSISKRKTPIRKISFFQIAASIVLLLSVSTLTYTFLAPQNSETIPLDQLVSQTSSQEIFDYLNENGMPADEEFLMEYVNNNNVSNLN